MNNYDYVTERLDFRGQRTRTLLRRAWRQYLWQWDVLACLAVGLLTAFASDTAVLMARSGDIAVLSVIAGMVLTCATSLAAISFAASMDRAYLVYASQVGAGASEELLPFALPAVTGMVWAAIGAIALLGGFAGGTMAEQQVTVATCVALGCWAMCQLGAIVQSALYLAALRGFEVQIHEDARRGKEGGTL